VNIEKSYEEWKRLIFVLVTYNFLFFSGETLTVHKPEVLHAPKIICPIQAKMVRTGDAVTLEAEFEGIPKPEVRWYHNGKEITLSEKVNITVEEHKTTLHIPQVFRPEGGKYEVRAVNPAGEARSSGTVSVTSKGSLTFIGICIIRLNILLVIVMYVLLYLFSWTRTRDG
jgi:hypothetical protein